MLLQWYTPSTITDGNQLVLQCYTSGAGTSDSEKAILIPVGGEITAIAACITGFDEDGSFDINIRDKDFNLLGAISVPANTAEYAESGLSIAVTAPQPIYCEVDNTSGDGSNVWHPRIAVVFTPTP